MSQLAVAALKPLPFEIVYDDGEPLESHWHRLQMTLLTDVIHQAMVERGKRDFFVGGNMFVYHSVDEAERIAKGGSYFRGPDVFFVDHVKGPERLRNAWLSWEEGGRLPDLIVELTSPSTESLDRTIKRDFYARIFRTPEYFLYGPGDRRIDGLRLVRGRYRSIAPNANGRIWSEQLSLELGLWRGAYRDIADATWLRLFDASGRLMPTEAEAERQRADTERQRADTERRRADALEAELARLKARLGE